MISKVSGGTINHVKALAFKIIKYLIDGIIDSQIGEEDFKSFKMYNNNEENSDNRLCKE